MLVAQLTDTHISIDGTRTLVDAAALLAEAIAYLNASSRRPDLVVATGDLTDHGHPDEYAVLRPLLEACEVPLVVMPGNHDELRPFAEALAPWCPGVDGGGGVGDLSFVVDDWPVRVVALDVTRAEHHDGLADAARLAWLDRVLAARPDVPTLVAMHHPPFRTGIWWMDAVGLHGGAEVEAIVRRHPQVRRVISGHVHRPIQTTWGDVLVSVAPSTAHQVACDLDPEHDPRIVAEPPMLTLLDFDGDACITHTTPFRADGPVVAFAEVVPDWPRAKAMMQAGTENTKRGHDALFAP